MPDTLTSNHSPYSFEHSKCDRKTSTSFAHTITPSFRKRSLAQIPSGPSREQALHAAKSRKKSRSVGFDNSRIHAPEDPIIEGDGRALSIVWHGGPSGASTRLRPKILNTRSVSAKDSMDDSEN
ncbi:hypothetical protein CEXT_662581 [Caerostris extrusa]|uniref:Uncharacterized protein n=1 Tax=Caerostris extrusa TaxID=172846 RepID=A0AAV4VD53_CAEEX|nr:hypothetical protein CEXT_662581 [Caerostris extrusa]